MSARTDAMNERIAARLAPTEQRPEWVRITSRAWGMIREAHNPGDVVRVEEWRDSDGYPRISTVATRVTTLQPYEWEPADSPVEEPAAAPSVESPEWVKLTGRAPSVMRDAGRVCKVVGWHGTKPIIEDHRGTDALEESLPLWDDEWVPAEAPAADEACIWCEHPAAEHDRRGCDSCACAASAVRRWDAPAADEMVALVHDVQAAIATVGPIRVNETWASYQHRAAMAVAAACAAALQQRRAADPSTPETQR